jgi:hypothetical protein
MSATPSARTVEKRHAYQQSAHMALLGYKQALLFLGLLLPEWVILA